VYVSSIPFDLGPPLIMASTSSVNADEEKKNVEHSNLAIHDENPVMNEKVDDNEEVPDDPATARKKRRLLWKIDLFILPLLVIVYFFGSMVSELVLSGMNERLISVRDVQTWEMHRLLE
jgi:hypothetical protein